MVYVPPPPSPQSDVDASAPPSPSSYSSASSSPYSSSSSSGWLDAWSLLLKEIRPPIPQGAPRSFVDLVRTDRQGRKRTLSPEVKTAEMTDLVRRLWRTLLPTLGYLTAEEVAMVKLALEVSCLAHQGQKRKSGAPFIEHPVEVARILAGLSMDVETICAGLLHDTAEDTHLSLEEIGAIFGEGVRQIVEGETKVSKLAKLGSSPVDYEETQAENLRSLFLAMTEDYRVIFTKLADRLHNMRTLEFMSPAKQVKISRETLDIYAPLADRLGVRGLKSELEDIAFRYVYPKESEEISAMLANRSEGYESVLATTHIALHQMLDRKLLLDQPAPLNLTVTGRLKEKYSLWRKMERKQRETGRKVTLDDIKDVVAMRIVINLDRLPDEPESEWKGRGIYACFRVMYLVQRHLSAPGYKSTVEDYISIPKVNGYMSLHSTIMRNGQEVEVQIRTDWMHAVAEMGLAAHWLYKDEQKGPSSGSSGSTSHYRTAWLTCLKDWQTEVIHAQDFVEAVRAEILGHRVSFFLKNGRIHDLPRGATLLDASFKLHKQIGLHLRLAEVNGLPVSQLDYVVQNGDVLYVVATRNAKPSPSWVTAAHCRTTRGKIRTYFRSKEPGVAEEEGRRLVQDLLQRNHALLEAKLGAVPTPDDLERSVRSHTGYSSLHEVYFQVALSAEHHDTGAMLGRVLGLDVETAHQLDLGAFTDTETSVRLGARGEQDPMFMLSHNGRETYRLCPVCRPVDGDPLTGLRTWEAPHGEVTVVHRADRACPRLHEEEEQQGGTATSSNAAGGGEASPATRARRVERVDAEKFNHDDGEGFFPVSVEVRAKRQRLYVLSNLVASLEAAEAMLLDASLGNVLPPVPASLLQGAAEDEVVEREGREEDDEDKQEQEDEAAEDLVIRFLIGVRELSQVQRVLAAFKEVGGVRSAVRNE